MPKTEPRTVHAPQQERSRQTLERILAAAEKLLETRDFDELTMVDLAREARCGVGTVYGRLPNKQSLLACLHERDLETGRTRSAAAFEAASGGGLAARVACLCSLIVDFLSERRGVSRAIALHLFSRPDADTFGFRERATAEFKQAAEFLAGAMDRTGPDSPREACEFALLAAYEVAQSRIVFGDRSGLELHYSRKELKGRLTDLMLAYLRRSGHHQEDRSG